MVNQSATPETILQAVAALDDLYFRVVSPSVSYADVDAYLARLALPFDLAGLKAVANGFGVCGYLTGKRAVLERLAKKIKGRKASHLSTLAILEPLR